MSADRCRACGASPDERGNVTHHDPNGPEARAWRIETARADAVAALTAAGGWDTAGLGDTIDVCQAIDAMRAYLVDPEFTGDKSRDVAALRALAVLLAALTELT